MITSLKLLINKVAEGRRIIVYGAGNQGRGIALALRERGIEPTAFIDGNPKMQGRVLAGIPVMTPSVIAEPGAAGSIFVVVAAFFFEREISALLDSHGFKRLESYISYSLLKPHDYAVEVSGVCNLRCISCPRGGCHSPERPADMMDLDTFKSVLAKIRRENPFVSNIQLYQWGEPTLNKHLPEMIRYAREIGILCAVSSNLNHATDFRALIEARPEWLRLSASGMEDNYEITHTGGNWKTFLANIEIVGKLRKDIYPEMKVELYYHRYKHSIGEQQNRMAEICKRLDIEFHPVPAYLISLDDVLAYCTGHPLPESAQRARNLLLVDLDEGLAHARKEAALECDAMRVIMINADLSVSTCMMFYYPEGNTVTDNFLSTPLEEIITLRTKATLCIKCKEYAIHRYCGIYAKLSGEESY